MSVSIVLRVVSKVLLAYFRDLYYYKPMVLLNSRAIDMVVKTSVSKDLHIVGLPIASTS